MNLEAYAARLRSGEGLPAPLDLALRPAERAIQWGMRRRLRQPATRVTAYVISFGNLTAGGTGKTPAVIERAQREIAEGRRVAILTRGYGAPSKEPASSDAVPPHERYRHLGDEAALVLHHVPEAVVFKNPDRVAAAHQAIKRFGCHILILDDGFQYTALERDENILVLDATCPFGNGRLVPRGILREPVDAMRRATAIILTRCDQADNLDQLRATISQHCSEAPIRETAHVPIGVVHVASGRIEPVEWLRGREAVAICGIGHPAAFLATLDRLGLRTIERIALRDHADWTPNVHARAETIVTTEKDAARMPSAPENLFALRIALSDWPPESE